MHGAAIRRTLPAAPDHGRANVVVVVGDLAIQAIEALVHVDLASALDRPYRADAFAQPARRAALRMPFEPAEHANAAENGETAAERTGETAVETLDEQAGEHERERVARDRPLRHETQDDGRLERLDLGSRHGEVPGHERRRDETEKHQVFDRDE